MSEIVYFGKHKGEKLSDIRDGYVKWMARQDKPLKTFLGEFVKRFGVESLPDTRACNRYKHILANPITFMGVIEGRDYQWMRAQWEEAGGDASQCPFGPDYKGPALGWDAGGQPIIWYNERV